MQRKADSIKTLTYENINCMQLSMSLCINEIETNICKNIETLFLEYYENRLFL